MNQSSSSSFNPIFEFVKLRLGKRDTCPWCRAVIPNVEKCKELLEEQECKESQQAIQIVEERQGRVPNITINVNFPDSGENNFVFKYDNNDRSSNTLITVLSYFAFVIYPNLYLYSKYEFEVIGKLLEQFVIRRAYPNDFILLEQVQAQLLDLCNTAVILSREHSSPPALTSSPLHSFSELDVIALFYLINRNHTRIELEHNIDYNSTLVHSLRNEEQRLNRMFFDK